MNINEILSKILGIKKPFKIDTEELEKIDPTIEKEDEHEIIIDVDTANDNEHLFEELLLEIYDEAKITTKHEDHNLHLIAFKSLVSYKNLLASHSDHKKEFLHYLFSNKFQKKRSKNNNSHELLGIIPHTFKYEIGYHILNSTIYINSPDFVRFFDAWKNEYPYEYPLRPLLRQLKKHTSVHKISPGLNTCLHSFLRAKSIQYLTINEYMDTKSSIHRIILDGSSINLVASSFLFLLLPDPLGTYVNKRLSKMNEIYQHNYAKIFKTLYDPVDQKKEIQMEEKIANIDGKKLDTFLYELINKVAYLRLRSITLRQKVLDSEKDYVYGTYEHMYKENILIIKGLVQIVGIRKNIQCIQPIVIIVERCFAATLGNNYGPTSRSLGNICIHTLAHQLDNQGQQELKKIYERTSSKLIKKQIELASKELEETTGTALI